MIKKFFSRNTTDNKTPKETKMQRIALSSFKGGTAKTSIALNLASALCKFHKKRVLLIDFDAQANLTTGLGYDPDYNDSMASVLLGNKKIEDVILKTPTKNLDLIPADTWLERVEQTGALAQDRYSHERLKELTKDLPYDFVLFDTPPSLSWLTESALIASDYSLICATTELYSIKGLQRLEQFIKGLINRHPLHILGVALSFWNQRGKNNQAFLKIIEDTFPGKLLKSKVRRDIAISEASILGKSIFEASPKSRGAQDLRSLTKEILKRI